MNHQVLVCFHKLVQSLNLVVQFPLPQLMDLHESQQIPFAYGFLHEYWPFVFFWVFYLSPSIAGGLSCPEELGLGKGYPENVPAAFDQLSRKVWPLLNKLDSSSLKNNKHSESLFLVQLQASINKWGFVNTNNMESNKLVSAIRPSIKSSVPKLKIRTDKLGTQHPHLVPLPEDTAALRYTKIRSSQNIK